MPKTMLIKAKPGLRIPLPESSYRYVEGDKPIMVDVDSYDRLVYWTRRIEHGECDLVPPSEAGELGTTTRLEPAAKTSPPSPFSTPAFTAEELAAEAKKQADDMKQGA